jgi:hypothetical protein
LNARERDSGSLSSINAIQLESWDCNKFNNTT